MTALTRENIRAEWESRGLPPIQSDVGCVNYHSAIIASRGSNLGPSNDFEVTTSGPEVAWFWRDESCNVVATGRVSSLEGLRDVLDKYTAAFAPQLCAERLEINEHINAASAAFKEAK